LTFTRKPGVNYFDGAITGMVRPMHFAVRLDDGRDIVAALPKSTLKRLGCILGDLTDCRVVVVFADAPKPPRIVDLSIASGSSMPADE
jgi:translation initiation factor IF-1